MFLKTHSRALLLASALMAAGAAMAQEQTHQAPATPAPKPPARPAGPPRGFSVGPNDQHVVDPAAADRGKKVYAAECIHCHGTNATGTERGADLIRSVVVLRDRYGNSIGEFLKKGHPTQGAKNLTEEQITDLSHWLHQRKIGTIRSNQDVGDILVGDAKAGEAYFNGEGKCNTCHSVTGDLARIGRRYNPVTIQQRFVFPNAGGFGRRRFAGGGGGNPPKPVKVTVTKDGRTYSGDLVNLDEFNVALRDANGIYHSFERNPRVKVDTVDPRQYHIDMLTKYTDKQIHDVVAYLEGIR